MDVRQPPIGQITEPRSAPSAASKPVLGGVMVLGAAVCFGTMPTFAKIAYSHGTDAFGLLTMRFSFATLAIWAFLLVRSGMPRFGPQHRGLPLMTVVFAGQSFCFFESLEHAPAVITVLLLYTYPLLVTLAAPVMLGEPLTRAKLGVLAAGFAGVTLTVGGVSGSLDAAGVAFGAASGVLFATFLVLAKRRLSADLDPVEMVAIIYAVLAAAYLVVFAFRGADLPIDANGWWALAGVVFIGTVASMILFASGLSQLPAGVTSMLSTLEPACSVALAAAVLGESVNAVQIVGIVLVLGSICWLGYLLLRGPGPEGYLDPI